MAKKHADYECEGCGLRFNVEIVESSQTAINYGIAYCPACGGVAK
ncbi:MAG: hypothetical protein WC455_27185 [Dehalococcoidia bacterium]